MALPVGPKTTPTCSSTIVTTSGKSRLTAARAKNLTDGVGRKEKTALRYVRLDPKERWIDPDKPMLLRAENQETRDSGFYRDKVNGDALPEKLLMAAKDFNNADQSERRGCVDDDRVAVRSVS